MANLKTRISLKYDTLENWGKSATAVGVLEKNETNEENYKIERNS